MCLPRAFRVKVESEALVSSWLKVRIIGPFWVCFFWLLFSTARWFWLILSHSLAWLRACAGINNGSGDERNGRRQRRGNGKNLNILFEFRISRVKTNWKHNNMGLCKCPKKKVTNQFCFEHRVNVCEHCLVSNHTRVSTIIWFLAGAGCSFSTKIKFTFRFHEDLVHWVCWLSYPFVYFAVSFS